MCKHPECHPPRRNAELQIFRKRQLDPITAGNSLQQASKTHVVESNRIPKPKTKPISQRRPRPSPHALSSKIKQPTNYRQANGKRNRLERSRHFWQHLSPHSHTREVLTHSSSPHRAWR